MNAQRCMSMLPRKCAPSAIAIRGADWAKKFVASVVFDGSPTDVPTIVGAIGLIVVIGALAGFLPARGASRVDPLIALQSS